MLDLNSLAARHCREVYNESCTIHHSSLIIDSFIRHYVVNLPSKIKKMTAPCFSGVNLFGQRIQG